MGVVQGLGSVGGRGVLPAIGRIGAVLRSLGILSLLIAVTGCQTTRTVSSRQLFAHQNALDFSGLKPTQDYNELHITCSPPEKWYPLAMQRTAIYTHEQWKSPTGDSGVGVVYIHMPLPLSPKALIWFAKMEYSKKSNEGKVLNEWTDELGRPWFEAENNKYHVRGYAVVDGFSAWIVYFGYKSARPLKPAELALAARCVETVVPATGEQQPSRANLADARR